MNKRTIIAAGGLVFNEQQELLMIFRRGKWDLPKGKLDEGELIEICAVREVEEETGLSNVVLGDLITKTYHEYFDKWIEEEVIKETWWYEMKVTNSPTLIPQVEEDIEKVVWANEKEVADFLKNSYPTIVDLVETFYKIKRGQ